MTSLAAIEADDGTRLRASGYVPAVDGLRALAVAAVVIFHFSRDSLRAGFLGVDVFFVVSGFLITRLLLREIEGTGSIGLVSFWGRRARRLLPALAVMTVIVVIVSAIEFSDTEMHDIRAHALGSLFYVANWVFIHGDASYFATLGRPSPFLHTWTLAIEEQFYLLFPLVMLVFRRGAVRRPLVAAGVAVGLAAASAVWMAHLVEPHRDPSRAYFGSDAHASGILIGVALGLLFAAGAVDRVRAHRARAAN
ncbi:MAG TPA: acyltransferase, partial [Acidimicrobiia bacterium]|nr:acyltransferase [Acidimicrobiia bacterium]